MVKRHSIEVSYIDTILTWDNNYYSKWSNYVV